MPALCAPPAAALLGACYTLRLCDVKLEPIEAIPCLLLEGGGTCCRECFVVSRRGYEVGTEGMARLVVLLLGSIMPDCCMVLLGLPRDDLLPWGKLIIIAVRGPIT